MATIVKDILTIDSGTIIHPVPCGSKISGGFSYQLTQKFPQVQAKHCETTRKNLPMSLLGKFSVVPVSDSINVVNLYCLMPNGQQNKFEYLAFQQGIERMFDSLSNTQFYFPYKLGCGIHGGNWKEIEKCIKSISLKYVICIMPTKKPE